MRRLVLIALCMCTVGHSAFAADARCADAERNTQYWIFGDNTVYASWRRLCREGNSAVDALLGALNGNPGAQAMIRACISEETAALSARNLDLVCEQIATGRPAVRAARAAPAAAPAQPAMTTPAAAAPAPVAAAAPVAPTTPAAPAVVEPPRRPARVAAVAPAPAPVPAAPPAAEAPPPRTPTRVAAPAAAVPPPPAPAPAPAPAAPPVAAAPPPPPPPAPPARPVAPKADLLATLQGTWCWKNSSGAQGQNTFSGSAVSVTEVGNLGLADSTLGKLSIVSDRQFRLEVSGGVQKLELIDHDTIKWQDGTIGRRCTG